MAENKLKKAEKSALKKLLLDQLKTHPALELQDMIKALYQSEFGGGHFVSDQKQGMEYLLEELDGLNQPANTEELVEHIGAEYSRVNLASMKKYGLSPDTLFRLFVMSSEHSTGSKASFALKLKYFEKLCGMGTLPFSREEVKSLISEYGRKDFPAVHHSDIFRRLYNPAYRVIRNDFARLLPILCRIDRLIAEKANAIAAIDGNSTSGKTTLAAILKDIYGCNVFHMDDFFLRPHQRTPERLAEPGGNVDYERFRTEVMEPLVGGGTFSYRPYSCRTQAFDGEIKVKANRLNVVEGAYSMHPVLSDFYDISLFTSIDAKAQKARVLERNGVKTFRRFVNEWIPMENRYFENMKIPEKCDFILIGDSIKENKLKNIELAKDM